MGFCLLLIDKQEVKRRLTYVCRCDERLRAKTKGSIRLTYTGLLGGLEHLKIETRLIRGLGVVIYGNIKVWGVCLLLIDKSRVKDKTYTRSVEECLL